MTLQDRFPGFLWLWRSLTGRTSRRIYVLVVVVVLGASAIARVYTFVLTRKAQAVVAGLAKLEIDETSEADLLRTVPYLTRNQWEVQLQRTRETGDIDTGLERFYYASFSNESIWLPFARFLARFSTLTYPKTGPPKSWALTLADWFGFRYFSFDAGVFLLNRKVSAVMYSISDNLIFPRPLGNIVSVKSAHSFWGPYGSTGVSSTDDENPQLRIRDNGHNLRASFTFDAPSTIKADVFQVNTTCFWGLVGCRNARQIAPALAQSKDKIQAATQARLQSSDPCPHRIIAGRVRYLPDLNVAILESTEPGRESSADTLHSPTEMAAHYKFIEILRGRSPNAWKAIEISPTIPFPRYPSTLPNRGLQWAPPGQQVLAFSNPRFSSCPLMLPTADALPIIRNPTPGPKRREDEAVGSLQ
jgi:hypothetical protein